MQVIAPFLDVLFSLLKEKILQGQKDILNIMSQ